MRAFIFRLSIVSAVFVAVAAVAAASLSLTGSAAQDVAGGRSARTDQPTTMPVARAVAHASSSGARPQLPSVLTDTGLRKPTGMTSDLDELYRIGLLASAGGRVLDKLAAQDKPKAELVKLRYFVGLSVEEAAEVLRISVPTANRHWAYAKAWLYREMSPPDAKGDPPKHSGV